LLLIWWWLEVVKFILLRLFTAAENCKAVEFGLLRLPFWLFEINCWTCWLIGITILLWFAVLLLNPVVLLSRLIEFWKEALKLFGCEFWLMRDILRICWFGLWFWIKCIEVAENWFVWLPLALLWICDKKLLNRFPFLLFLVVIFKLDMLLILLLLFWVWVLFALF
jgi:hypothetical protein